MNNQDKLQWKGILFTVAISGALFAGLLALALNTGLVIN